MTIDIINILRGKYPAAEPAERGAAVLAAVSAPVAKERRAPRENKRLNIGLQDTNRMAN